MMIDSTMIGKTVTFDTYGAAIMGKVFTRCRVLGILDIDTARYFTDVERLAVALYPLLPEGTAKDYRKYQYIKLRLVDGSDYCIANEWIKQDTLVVNEHLQATIVIRDINADDIDKISKLLLTYNYRNFSIDFN